MAPAPVTRLSPSSVNLTRATGRSRWIASPAQTPASILSGRGRPSAPGPGTAAPRPGACDAAPGVRPAP